MANTPKQITGVKTDEQKARARKNARGPKPGSAMLNQMSGLPASDDTAAQIKAEAESRRPVANENLANENLAKSDVIASVTNARSGGEYVIVSAPGQQAILIRTEQFTGAVAKAAKVGGSYAAVKAVAPKPAARLAKGVDAHTAPHAAKAVADGRTPASKPAAKASEPKGAKNKMPAPGGDRKYKLLVKPADIKAKAGSWTEHMLRTILAHTSTAAASAANAKSKEFAHKKLDFGWTANVRKYIAFA